MDALSELFHENTKIRAAFRGFSLSAEALQAMSEGYKHYDLAESTPLPVPVRGLSMPVGEAIRTRRSAREYSGQGIDIETLGALIYYGCGLTVPDGVRRLVPSAGGLYPLEVYPMVLNAKGLPGGVYHYDVRAHSLELLSASDYRESFGNAIFVEELAKTGSVVVIITAVFARTKIKYGERGYRFALLEAGHLAQNLCIAAVALGLGACPIGGFVDDHVNEMVDVDGVDEAAIYLVAVGSDVSRD